MTRAVVFVLVAVVSAQDFLAANPLNFEHVSIADDVVANQLTTLVDDAVAVTMVDDAALVAIADAPANVTVGTMGRCPPKGSPNNKYPCPGIAGYSLFRCCTASGCSGQCHWKLWLQHQVS